MKENSNNKKKRVDEITELLLNGNDIEPMDVIRSLNQSFNQLDSTSYAEREALKNVVTASLVLSKTIAALIKKMHTLETEVSGLKKRIAV